MTLREVQALLLLFRSCENEAARKRAIELVPDLAEWQDTCPEPAQRWLLTAEADGHAIGEKRVVSRESDIAVHEMAFVAEFDLATNVVVRRTRLP